MREVIGREKMAFLVRFHILLVFFWSLVWYLLCCCLLLLLFVVVCCCLFVVVCLLLFVFRDNETFCLAENRQNFVSKYGMIFVKYGQ